MSITTTHANGNEITRYSHMSTVPARRFAAECDRDADAIESIETAAGTGDVTVRLATPDDIAQFDIPDGWAVVRVRTLNSTTWLRLDEVQA